MTHNTKSAKIHFVASMIWTEVEECLASGATAILPIGAGSKQHGLHMPMNTDQIQAEWFAARLAETIDALIWPTVTYGTYPAFTAYSGSISLSTLAFKALVTEIVEGLSAFGAKRVLLLNTGISTIEPLQRVVRNAQPGGFAELINLYAGPSYKKAVSRLRQQAHGSHADEIETSIMLAIAPELVAMNRALSSPPLRNGPAAGPLNQTDPASPNYSASGSLGDPTLATIEKGVLLRAAILEDLNAAASAASH